MKCVQLLKYTGWFTFFKKITRYNVEVSREFAKRFMGTRVDFTSVSFEVSEHSIVEAIGLDMDGDKRFKIFPFEVDLGLFLLSGHETLEWNRGIHKDALKEEW